MEGETPTAAMRKMVRSDGAIPQILQKWKDKQEELREEVCPLFISFQVVSFFLVFGHYFLLSLIFILFPPYVRLSPHSILHP